MHQYFTRMSYLPTLTNLLGTTQLAQQDMAHCCVPVLWIEDWATVTMGYPYVTPTKDLIYTVSLSPAKWLFNQRHSSLQQIENKCVFQQ